MRKIKMWFILGVLLLGGALYVLSLTEESSDTPASGACRGRLTPLGARASRPQSRACARRTLILAFSHKGLTGVGLP